MNTRLYRHTSRESKNSRITAGQPDGRIRPMGSAGHISRLLPAVLLLLVLLAGCSQEDGEQYNPPAVQPGKNVTLEVRIPATKTPATYGMTAAQENDVTQLTVLAYQDISGTEQLQQKIAASAGDITNDGAGNMKVSLMIPQGDYSRLVLIANADTQAGSLALGSSLAALQSLQYTHATGRWDVSAPDYIPMSGQVVAATTNGLEIRQGISKTFANLQLTRMLARVDIRNNAQATFTLKEVSLYNMNRNGLIACDDTKYNASPAAPNLPASLQAAASPMTYDYAALQSVGAMDNEIYLFEAAKATTATIATSPRIILKGTYNAVDYYYPVDFTYSATGGTVTRGEFMPVVRNHQYIFTITKVLGPGFASAGDALASKDSFTNIQVKVLAFDNDFTDVYYNALNFLAVNTTGVEKVMGPAAYNSATADNTITVLTDAATFTIECYDNATGAIAASNLMRSNATSYTGGSSVSAHLIANNTSTATTYEFDGYVIVRAGSLQSERIPVRKWWCGKDGIALVKTIGTNSYKTHRYPTETAGAMQCWMVENSREGTHSSKGYGLDASGNSIGTISIGTLGTVNGYYYTHSQASTTNNACPSGWSLPTQAQWTPLMNTVNTDLSNTTAKWWGGPQGAANNAYAGRGGNNGANWDGWSAEGCWWSTNSSYRVFSITSGMQISYSPISGSWLSVRCLQD